MAAERILDDPWQRLYWVAPLALVLTAGSQLAFVYVLEQPAVSSPVASPIDVRIVELSPEIRVPEPVRTAEAPRPLRPKSLPPKPKAEPVTPTPPSPSSEPAPSPERLPEPLRRPEPESPREAAQPPAATTPQTAVPPSPTAAAEPRIGGPAETPVRTGQPPVTAAVPPTPPISGTPGGTGLGGGKGGARAIYKPLPEIPETLRHQNIDVVAIARFRVAANGSAQVELIGPTPDPDLNRALLDALRRWRFFPGMEDGKPVPSTVDIRIPVQVK